jgi:hypothetical protein
MRVNTSRVGNVKKKKVYTKEERSGMMVRTVEMLMHKTNIWRYKAGKPHMSKAEFKRRLLEDLKHGE